MNLSERDVICLAASIRRCWRTTSRTAKEYGYITRLGSHVFFHGLAVGETNKVNIEDGKTLVIKYLGLGDAERRRHPCRSALS